MLPSGRASALHYPFMMQSNLRAMESRLAPAASRGHATDAPPREPPRATLAAAHDPRAG